MIIAQGNPDHGYGDERGVQHELVDRTQGAAAEDLHGTVNLISRTQLHHQTRRSSPRARRWSQHGCSSDADLSNLHWRH